jgi:hypothetical protein
MKSCIFWYITPCSPLKGNRRFGGTYRLHLQGRIISQARNQCEADSKQGSALLLLVRPFLALSSTTCNKNHNTTFPEPLGLCEIFLGVCRKKMRSEWLLYTPKIVLKQTHKRGNKGTVTFFLLKTIFSCSSSACIILFLTFPLFSEREFICETSYKRLAIRGWDRSSVYLLKVKRGAEGRIIGGKKSFRKRGSSIVIFQANAS